MGNLIDLSEVTQYLSDRTGVKKKEKELQVWENEKLINNHQLMSLLYDKLVFVKLYHFIDLV